MAIQIIPDSGSFTFFARELADAAGNQQTRAVQIIAWSIDDATLAAVPVVFPALAAGEILGNYNYGMFNKINMVEMKNFSFCYFLPQTLPI